jgi:hypothetical protein
MDFKAIGLLTLVVGCAGPGETIDVISTSPASVALEYTHSYSFELGETVKAAERHCNKYRRHAVMASNTRLNIDRSLATFRCVN